MPSSKGSSRSRDQTCIFCIAGEFSKTEPPGKLISIHRGSELLLESTLIRVTLPCGACAGISGGSFRSSPPASPPGETHFWLSILHIIPLAQFQTPKFGSLPNFFPLSPFCEEYLFQELMTMGEGINMTPSQEALGEGSSPVVSGSL